MNQFSAMDHLAAAARRITTGPPGFLTLGASLYIIVHKSKRDIYFQLIASAGLYSLEFRLTLQCTDINVAKFGWFSHTAALLLKDFMYEFQPLNLTTNV